MMTRKKKRTDKGEMPRMKKQDPCPERYIWFQILKSF
jgi:hypothetical protein